MDLKNIKKVFVFGLCVLVFVGCAQSNRIPLKVPVLTKQTLNHLLVAMSDYQTGLLGEIDLLQNDKKPLEISIHSDAIVRAPENLSYFYVVNRLGADNIEWGDRQQKRILGQFSVGRGTNPQDIAVVTPELAYVSRLASKTLLKVNPKKGEILREIDLFENASAETVISTDPDGFPEMTWMMISGNKLFVILQRLNSETGYEPSNRSQVAVVDITTDKVDRIINLKGTNPVTEIKSFGEGFILGQAGKLGFLDGGVELFDFEMNSLGWVTTEKELGGDIIDCLMLNSDVGVAIVAQEIYGSKPRTRLVAFRRTDGKVSSILKDPGIYSLQQILLDDVRGLFYLSDRNIKNPGIWIFDTKTLQPLSEGFFQTSLPPYHMVLTR